MGKCQAQTRYKLANYSKKAHLLLLVISILIGVAHLRSIIWTGSHNRLSVWIGCLSGTPYSFLFQGNERPIKKGKMEISGSHQIPCLKMMMMMPYCWHAIHSINYQLMPCNYAGLETRRYGRWWAQGILIYLPCGNNKKILDCN